MPFIKFEEFGPLGYDYGPDEVHLHDWNIYPSNLFEVFTIKYKAHWKLLDNFSCTQIKVGTYFVFYYSQIENMINKTDKRAVNA